jgi:zinc/manganese transport system substrate-binding protein
MGDIHPMGNPHYWFPPSSARLLAKEIADRLSQLDPEGKAAYQKNLAAFLARVDAKEKEWTPLVAKLKGIRIATYHKSWTYVSQWLGMEEIGYVEPKPGIPPDPQHLVHLIATMKSEGARLLLMEDFYNKNTAQLVAEKAGAKLLDLPTDVGARPEIKDWFTLVEFDLRRLAAALP